MPLKQPKKMFEGLLLFASTFSHILVQLCPGIQRLMGDITYGACYIDDYTERALGYDLLDSYTHDCLIPVEVTKTKVLYVFVDIGINASHPLVSLGRNFSSSNQCCIWVRNRDILGPRSWLSLSGIQGAGGKTSHVTVLVSSCGIA
ncbi:putative diphthamide synthesis protein-domain-containing protein [Fusarium oxysporum]|nr:putative diphthamide synthesis protein-domain-containing protein [Fusarium oxysporum]